MLNNIPVEKILKALLSSGSGFAEIFAERTVSTSIINENRKMEKAISGSDSGYGLRLIRDGKTFYGFTNDPRELMNVALEISGKGTKENLASQPSEKSSDNINLQPKIDLVKRASDFSWKSSDKIKQVQVNFRDTRRDIWIANSDGVNISDSKSETIFVVHIIVSKDGRIQTGYEPFGGTFGVEQFEKRSPEEIAESALKRALIMLEARPAPRGMMPVVMSSEGGGTMIHEAVGHGLEKDIVKQGASIYKDRIGSQVASKLVTVIDDGTYPMLRGTFSFDDEGTPAQKTILIENGILKKYMNSRLTKDLEPLTGNGRRESYRNRPVVRMTNTMIAPGKDDPKSIVSSVEKGLFVRKLGGGQVNTLNGDFVFEAQEAYLLEKGKVGEPVRGATLIGNGPNILMSIDMVGADIGFGLGTCGKEGQGVPVGHGMPTLRVPEMTVGGTG